MKKASLLALALVMSLALVSTASAFDVGTGAPSLTMVGPRLGLISYGYSGTTTGSIPPIGASFELPLTKFSKSDSEIVKNIGVGAQFLYESWTYEYSWLTTDTYKWTYSHSYITLFGAYYYDGLKIKGLKPFGKFQLGYYIASVKFSSSNASLENLVGKQTAASSFTYNFSVGTRYFFSKNLSAVFELGYGISVFTLGLDFGF